MKKMIALGLAGALAAASVGASTLAAEAGTVSRAGATVPGYPTNTVEGHVAWCRAHYRSYRPPPVDAFLGADGLWHRCISPH